MAKYLINTGEGQAVLDHLAENILNILTEIDLKLADFFNKNITYYIYCIILIKFK
jgi:hypothetical protein